MRFLAALAVACALASPAVAEGYDDTWYAADFWTGEYPDGFSVSGPVTIKIRPELSPAAEPSVDCQLADGATYHPWNAQRVESDKLVFKSFTRIDENVVNADTDATLYDHEDGTETKRTFKKGERWRYLTYLAEGMFLMEVDGKLYEGDQGLIENSKSVVEGIGQTDEWMGLTCANGATGWLLFADTVDVPGIAEPNIVTYGEAADAK